MSLELEKEETVQLLCRQFAHDQLSTQELEKQIDAVYRASTQDELRALVANLPATVPTASGVQQSGRDSVAFPPSEQRVRALFSSVKKRGEWTAAEHTRVRAVFSEVELDFREARISPGVTTVTVDAGFSSVRIIVPPGLHVECDGSAVFGEFSHKTFLNAEPGADAPTVRIVGRVVFGEVKVVMRMPERG